jgi:hypothetical protein
VTDTSPEFEKLYRNLLMAKSPDERFRMGLSMCESARAIVLSSLPEGLSEVERKVALLYRYYGNDLRQEELARIEAQLRSAPRSEQGAAMASSLS